MSDVDTNEKYHDTSVFILAWYHGHGMVFYDIFFINIMYRSVLWNTDGSLKENTLRNII